MSRFARLHGGAVRTWAPPESPLRIEYSAALLREVRIANAGVDAFGTLYGVSHGKTIRLVATRGRAGLDPLGVFASRVRGQVFLTEEDLERFERAEASVALVVSGDQAGFFVRDHAGSIETVRSYQEFSLDGPPPVLRNEPKKRTLAWAWCLLTLLPLLAFLPRPQHPSLALALQEDAGMMRIHWNLPVESTLTILDGHAETRVAIHPSQTHVSYARRTGDVTARVGSTEAIFVGPPAPPSEIERLRSDLETLKAKVATLKTLRAAGQMKIAALERRLQ